MRSSKRRRGNDQPPAEDPAVIRQEALALLATMVHGDYLMTETLLPRNLPQAQAISRDLSMMAAALLINWSKEIGVPPNDLLSDIAIGQALDATTR
jgi:hypothetical protein